MPGASKPCRIAALVLSSLLGSCAAPLQGDPPPAYEGLLTRADIAYHAQLWPDPKRGGVDTVLTKLLDELSRADSMPTTEGALLRALRRNLRALQALPDLNPKRVVTVSRLPAQPPLARRLMKSLVQADRRRDSIQAHRDLRMQRDAAVRAYHAEYLELRGALFCYVRRRLPETSESQASSPMGTASSAPPAGPRSR